MDHQRFSFLLVGLVAVVAIGLLLAGAGHDTTTGFAAKKSKKLAGEFVPGSAAKARPAPDSCVRDLPTGRKRCDVNSFTNQTYVAAEFACSSDKSKTAWRSAPAEEQCPLHQICMGAGRCENECDNPVILRMAMDIRDDAPEGLYYQKIAHNRSMDLFNGGNPVALNFNGTFYYQFAFVGMGDGTDLEENFTQGRRAGRVHLIANLSSDPDIAPLSLFTGDRFVFSPQTDSETISLVYPTYDSMYYVWETMLHIFVRGTEREKQQYLSNLSRMQYSRQDSGSVYDVEYPLENLFEYCLQDDDHTLLAWTQLPPP